MPTLYIALIAAAFGFGGAWEIQSLRADALEKDHAQSQLAQEQDARKLDQARTSALAAAQNAGAARQIRLRADADAARDALDSLRIASSHAVSSARSDPVACVVTATTQAVILDQCASEYQALAGVADRHASDIKTLTDAWSK